MKTAVWDSRSGSAVVDVTDMRAWATAYGSMRLQLALARGYQCTRTYLEERAARDFPGWALLADDRNVEIIEATDPGEKALRLESEALKLAQGLRLAPGSVRVVDMRTTYWSEEDGEYFTIREAVLISGYLGELTLVRTV